VTITDGACLVVDVDLGSFLDTGPLGFRHGIARGARALGQKRLLRVWSRGCLTLLRGLVITLIIFIITRGVLASAVTMNLVPAPALVANVFLAPGV
jgi:hypothetical protein